MKETSASATGWTGIRITGRVATPQVVGWEQLTAMASVEIDGLQMICGSGEPKGPIGRCKGVLLSDIINSVDVLITDHNDTKKMYIIASADDGYKTVFSWQEIFNTATGEGVMVILEKENMALDPDRQMVDLLSTRDFLTGPRHVRELSNIEIVMVE